MKDLFVVSAFETVLQQITDRLLRRGLRPEECRILLQEVVLKFYQNKDDYKITFCLFA